ASLQYSVYTSALSFLADRRSPERAGHLLFDAVRRRLDRMPPARRPRLFVAGESLGSFGGHAAFRDVPDMLAPVDGAGWTGTPATAPNSGSGRHVRVVTRPRDRQQEYCGGISERWQHPRVVYAQHRTDPVAWWQPSLLWDEPKWLPERVGHDVTPAVRWFPWS